jgi:high-affinity Fe2+/Pb2+ permease
MGAFSTWHIVILAIIAVGFVLPISKILRRAGWNMWLEAEHGK